MLRSREVSMRGSVSPEAARSSLAWLYSMRSRREMLHAYAYEMHLGRFREVAGGTDVDLRYTMYRGSGRGTVAAGAVLQARLRADGTGCRLDGKVRPNRLHQGALLALGAGCAAGAVALGSLLFVTAPPTAPANGSLVVGIGVVAFVAMAVLFVGSGVRMADSAVAELVHDCEVIILDAPRTQAAG